MEEAQQEQLENTGDHIHDAVPSILFGVTLSGLPFLWAKEKGIILPKAKFVLSIQGIAEKFSMSTFNNDIKSDDWVHKSALLSYSEADAELAVNVKGQWMAMLSSSPQFEAALADLRVHNGMSKLIRITPGLVDVLLKRIRTSSSQVQFVGWLASLLPGPWRWKALRDYILPPSLHPHLEHVQRESSQEQTEHLDTATCPLHSPEDQGDHDAEVSPNNHDDMHSDMGHMDRYNTSTHQLPIPGGEQAPGEGELPLAARSSALTPGEAPSSARPPVPSPAETGQAQDAEMQRLQRYQLSLERPPKRPRQSIIKQEPGHTTPHSAQGDTHNQYPNTSPAHPASGIPHLRSLHDLGLALLADVATQAVPSCPSPSWPDAAELHDPEGPTEQAAAQATDMADQDMEEAGAWGSEPHQAGKQQMEGEETADGQHDQGATARAAAQGLTATGVTGPLMRPAIPAARSGGPHGRPQLQESTPGISRGRAAKRAGVGRPQSMLQAEPVGSSHTYVHSGDTLRVLGGRCILGVSEQKASGGLTLLTLIVQDP